MPPTSLFLLAMIAMAPLMAQSYRSLSAKDMDVAEHAKGSEPAQEVRAQFIITLEDRKNDELLGEKEEEAFAGIDLEKYIMKGDPTLTDKDGVKIENDEEWFDFGQIIDNLDSSRFPVNWLGVFTLAEPPEAETVGWRIIASTSTSGWAWDVRRLKFIDDRDEEVNPFDYGCTVITSGNHHLESYEAKNAFRSSNQWGGRKGGNDAFYLGFDACTKRFGDVSRVVLNQSDDQHTATSITIQKKKVGGEWQDVKTRDGLKPGTNEIVLSE